MRSHTTNGKGYEMSINSKLLAKRTDLYGKIKKLADAFNANGQKWANDQQSSEWNSVNKEYDAVMSEIDAAKKVDEVSNRTKLVDSDWAPVNPDNIGLGDSGSTRRPRHEYVIDKNGKRHPLLGKKDSMKAAMLRQNPDLAEQNKGLTVGGFIRSIAIGSRSVVERNALLEGGGATGGYTVPSLLAAEMIDLLRAKSRVIQAGAKTINMPAAEMTFAKLTGDPTPIWAQENGLVNETEPTFGAINFSAKTLRMLITCSRELLEDSINLNLKLPEVFAAAMAAEVDRVALAGTDASGQPLGVLNYPNINSVSMGANGATPSSYSQILDAVQAIETANAEAPTVAIMHPRTKRTYAGLLDTTNQPLLPPPAIQNLQFLTTTKLSITETQGAANNASSMILGGFSEMVLAVRSDIRIDLLQERYAEYFKYGFLVSLRMDAGPWHEEAFAKIIGIKP